MTQRRFAVLFAIALATGCAFSPLRDSGIPRGTVTAIEIIGVQNLNDKQMKITDPDEIKEILQLIRRVRSGFTYAMVNLDPSKTQIVRFRFVNKKGEGELTMVSGLMPVPDDSTGLFYNSDEEAQDKLWHLALTRLDPELDKKD